MSFLFSSSSSSTKLADRSSLTVRELALARHSLDVEAMLTSFHTSGQITKSRQTEAMRARPCTPISLVVGPDATVGPGRPIPLNLPPHPRLFRYCFPPTS
ncbi:hypothetical protein E2C01_081835 [Portunus trituberculatus]|uniref:Uncharacterized protein n=1 Tax=Portunus trituberculatus TaxID=210409 RepID=A0A5B7IQU1_PORTR|nr:hypothetical protein [Portunus trituberculatus]